MNKCTIDCTSSTLSVQDSKYTGSADPEIKYYILPARPGIKPVVPVSSLLIVNTTHKLAFLLMGRKVTDRLFEIESAAQDD